MARYGENSLVSQVAPPYSALTKQKQVFFAASQAVATTTVGLSQTYTGLCVSNPITSRVDLHLITATVNQSVIQGAQPEAYGLAVGYHTTNVGHTAAAAVYSGYVGNVVSTNQAVALADTSASLPAAPFYARFIGNTASATVLGTTMILYINGDLVLAPGAFACFVTPAQASVAGLWFSLSWAELPRTQELI